MKLTPNEEWLIRHLPVGYRAYLRFGRWDLFRNDEEVRTGIRNRWEVLKIAKLHNAGKRLPYRYSRQYWNDIEHGKSGLWAKVASFLRLGA